jgi:DNA-binding Lrp family transcriptional regulator
MKQEELLAMSQKERDRLKVLQEAKQKQITQKEAGEQIGVTERWVRKLLAKMRKKGDRAAVHGLRGRNSNRKIPEAVRERAVKLVKQEYGDFGPTLASEYLGERHGLEVSRETLRGWMIGAGLWRPRRARVERVHTWRARRAQWGELLQWDTSEHDGLEERGEKLYLILMIDDASSRALARFVRHDSTEENLRTLRAYVQRWGRPAAVYTDRAGLFKINRPQRIDEQLRAELPKTQIGRALEELGIEWIAAHSPQAKGRVERFFGTAQDRLVKGLRKAGACTLEEAQRYLERVYLPLWNRRFTVPAANSTDAHRPLGPQHDLAAILSHVESRVVADDYTFRFQAVRYQIAKPQVRPGLRGARVRVEKRLDGKMTIRFRERYLAVSRCDPAERQSNPKPRLRQPRTAAQPRQHSWMKDFHLQRNKPIWAVLNEERGQPPGEAGFPR